MKSEFKKIEAFTLSEMIVALAITTIVVGMSYAVGIEENYEKNTKLHLLKQSLWFDFNTGDKVFYNSEKRELSIENELKI